MILMSRKGQTGAGSFVSTNTPKYRRKQKHILRDKENNEWKSKNGPVVVRKVGEDGND